MTIVISEEDPEQEQVLAMLADSDQFYQSLYPAESNHLLDVESLRRSGTTFLVASSDGLVRGFGAVVDCGGEYGEIKRMYVAPTARQMGLGRMILEELEKRARICGLPLMRLETGIRQPAAIELYRSAGYVETQPFGSYELDPLSIFMEKKL